MKIDFSRPTHSTNPNIVEKQEAKVDLLQSCLRFLIQMAEGSASNTAGLENILDSLNGENILRLMFKIYKERIRNIQRELVLEIACGGKNQSGHSDCTNSLCVEG